MSSGGVLAYTPSPYKLLHAPTLPLPASLLPIMNPCQVRELVDEHTWEEHCIGHAADDDLDIGEVAPKQLCLVAFLPHILDSKAAGRQAYLEVRGTTPFYALLPQPERHACLAERSGAARLTGRAPLFRAA